MKRLIRKANKNSGKYVYFEEEGESFWAGPLEVMMVTDNMNLVGDTSPDHQDANYYISKLNQAVSNYPDRLRDIMNETYETDKIKLIEFLSLVSEKNRNLLNMIYALFTDEQRTEIYKEMMMGPRKGFTNIGIQVLRSIVMRVFERDKEPYYVSEVYKLDGSQTPIIVPGKRFERPVGSVDNGEFEIVNSLGIKPAGN